MKTLEELGISPEPWDVHIGGKGDNTYALIFDARTEAVADLSSFDHPECEESNARLIAAAPELYEALRVLVNIQYEGAKEDMLIPAAWQYARIALAKAGGAE